MIELKVYHCNEWHNEYTEFYLKYDADKVIADLEESRKKEVEQLLMEIVSLKDKLQNVSELLKETREWLIESQKMHKRCADNAIKKIRCHKYKRCRAMAKWCHNESLWWYSKGYGFEKYDKFWEKWEKRWLELAEKFKPNNSTAQ